MIIEENSLDNIKKAGIYKISCLSNGKFYIGSTFNFIDRFYKHNSKLKNKCHSSRYLQNAWNKHGEDLFIFEIIELVDDINFLLQREQWYLDNWKPWDKKIGYNISKNAFAAMLGLKHSQESKDKIGNAHKKRCNENPNLRSEELGKEFIIESPEGIIYKDKGLVSFCKKFNINPKGITRVLLGKQKHYKLWRLPGQEIWDCKFINPEGKIITIIKHGLSKFCRNNNLSYKQILEVWNKKCECFQGYSRFDNPNCHFKITSPTNEIFIVYKGIAEKFANQHNLTVNSFYKIIRGKWGQYKGWRAEKLFK